MSLKTTVILVLAASVLISSSALAGGLYLGASIGNSFVSGEIEDATEQAQKIDENSTGYKFFGGFNSASFLSIEGGYRDFGTVESSSGGSQLKSSTKGWDIEAMGRITLSIVDLFGKAGAMFWNTDSSAGGTSEEVTGTDFLWGLGAGVSLGPIGVRLEWEKVESSRLDNLSMVSLGATFGF